MMSTSPVEVHEITPDANYIVMYKGNEYLIEPSEIKRIVVPTGGWR